MSKNLTIKEQDLHAIVKDLMDKALAISRPNKEKICKFVVNLVENGGHKTKAALDAGYGEEKDRNGQKQTLEQRKGIASTEAIRLLKSAEISAVYESLLSHRFLSQVFVKNLTKEHIISILYQAGLIGLCSERNFKSGISALVEASKLAGFSDDDSRKDIDRLIAAQEEIARASTILPSLVAQARKTLSENKRKRLN